MQNTESVFVWGFKIPASFLIVILLVTANLLAKTDGDRNVISIQNPGHRMILITPQMIQQPELYKIQLSETQELSRPVFSLYHRTGVKVLEKQIKLIAPFNSIPFEIIFNRPARLPADYYFYDLRNAGIQSVFPTSDSLFFRDVSNTHLPMDSTLGGFTESADVNGDSFPDIITGFFGFHQPRILMNDGTGHFSDQTSQRFPQVEISVNDLAVVDVDQDGDLDIFFAAADTQFTGASSDRLFLNNGNGHFSDVSITHLPQLPTISESVDWGFINDDHYPDLLISSPICLGPPYQTCLFVLINDGSGHFANQSTNYLPQTAYSVFDAALADVNQDSLVDIVMASIAQTVTDENGNILFEFDGQDAVLIQNDNNQFVDETSTRMPPEDYDNGKLIKIADINNDLAPELYVINLTLFVPSPPHTLYLNDGNGYFSEVTASRIPQQNITLINDVEFRDFDANGYVDMYIVNVIPGIPAQDFLNFNNNGFFTDVSQLLPERIDYGISCSTADMERDGDFDVFVSNGAGTVGEKGLDLLLENLQIKTAISYAPAVRAGHFYLSQNHPNPFNPTTKIQFSLPRPSLVTLKIYNTHGEEVATLVNEKLSAHPYEVKWDASGVANGVYLYRLQTDGFVETKKLTVLK